jgi:hypothetical protein
LLQPAGYLPRLRETPDLRPGKQALPVHDDFKDTVSARYQPGLDIKSRTQFFRQTGGLQFKVS